MLLLSNFSHLRLGTGVKLETAVPKFTIGPKCERQEEYTGRAAEGPETAMGTLKGSKRKRSPPEEKQTPSKRKPVFISRSTDSPTSKPAVNALDALDKLCYDHQTQFAELVKLIDETKTRTDDLIDRFNETSWQVETLGANSRSRFEDRQRGRRGHKGDRGGITEGAMDPKWRVYLAFRNEE